VREDRVSEPRARELYLQVLVSDEMIPVVGTPGVASYYYEQLVVNGERMDERYVHQLLVATRGLVASGSIHDSAGLTEWRGNYVVE